jgi:hypothetical protein
MKLKAVYPDGSWIVGERITYNLFSPYRETQGTHHLKVIDASDIELRAKKVAVVISQVKYFILEYKERE